MNRGQAAHELPETMASPERAARPRPGAGWRTLTATGGVLGALAASSCCILPLALFGLGLGGAWVGNLAALAPYQPIFLGIAFAFIGFGYYLVYRRPGAACVEGAACAPRSSGRIVKPALWVATVLVAAAIAFPYAAAPLLGL